MLKEELFTKSKNFSNYEILTVNSLSVRDINTVFRNLYGKLLSLVAISFLSVTLGF